MSSSKSRKNMKDNIDRLKKHPNKKYIESILKDQAEGKLGNSELKNNDGIIRPEDIDSDKFDEVQEEPYQGLITQETLDKEEQEIREEAQKYAESFHRQFNDWKDIDEWSEYQWCGFDHEDYLVRLFKMDLSEFDKFKSLKYTWSPILKNWKLEDTQLHEGVMPIAKILAIGSGVKEPIYKVGDIVLVPSSDIYGEDWNPQFLHVMQFQQSKGMNPVLPEGMRQRIPNVEKNWERYMFVRPWVPKPEEQDYLTYLIPSPKVKGSYDGSKVGI